MEIVLMMLFIIFIILICIVGKIIFKQLDFLYNKIYDNLDKLNHCLASIDKIDKIDKELKKIGILKNR